MNEDVQTADVETVGVAARIGEAGVRPVVVVPPVLPTPEDGAVTRDAHDAAGVVAPVGELDRAAGEAGAG